MRVKERNRLSEKKRKKLRKIIEQKKSISSSFLSHACLIIFAIYGKDSIPISLRIVSLFSNFNPQSINKTTNIKNKQANERNTSQTNKQIRKQNTTQTCFSGFFFQEKMKTRFFFKAIDTGKNTYHSAQKIVKSLHRLKIQILISPR